MASPRRRNLLIVIAIVALALVAAAVLVGPRIEHQVRRALRPQPVAVVPRESSVMFRLDLDRLRDTPTWKGLLQAMKSSEADAAFQDLQLGIGFNPVEEV